MQERLLALLKLCRQARMAQAGALVSSCTCFCIDKISRPGQASYHHSTGSQALVAPSQDIIVRNCVLDQQAHALGERRQACVALTS